MLRRVAISCLLAVLAWPATARTRPHYGGTLRVEVTGDPLAAPNGLARRLIFDTLTTLGPEGKVQPELAASWQADVGAHHWEFKLRPGVTFQDGSPLTATAVVNSLNRSCNGNCPWSAVNSVGSSSVVFTSDSPMPHLPAQLAGDEFLITLTVGASGLPPANPTGTGPFQFTSNANGTLTLTASQTCWKGRPFADTVQIRGDRSIRDQWLDLTLGRADVVEVPSDMVRRASLQQFTVITSPPVKLLALQLSTTGALSDPMLRASIAQAVDRGALFNVIFQKQGELTAALLPQELTGYAFLFPTNRDLDKAVALRGGVHPPPLKLATQGDGAVRLAAQRIALNLHDAGFQVQVVPGNVPNPDLTLGMLPLIAGSPAAALEILLRAAGQPQAIAAQSPADLYRTEKNILDQHTIVPLLDLPSAWAVSGRVRNLSLRADGSPDLADTSLEDAQ